MKPAACKLRPRALTVLRPVSIFSIDCGPVYSTHIRTIDRGTLMNVSLPADLKRQVERELATGQYTTSVVVDARVLANFPVCDTLLRIAGTAL